VFIVAFQLFCVKQHTDQTAQLASTKQKLIGQFG